MEHNGLFIAIEGGDGSGKSTICNWLKDKLTKDGFDVFVTREPGGIESAEAIRNLIFKYDNLDHTTQTLLFEAARSINVKENIVPRLDRGYIVITDRYTLSTLVYQGYIGGLRILDIYKLNDFATGRLSPDVTFILDINTRTAVERMKSNDRETNYIDQKDIDFHAQVDEYYYNYTGIDVKHIDANCSIDEVGHKIMNLLNVYIQKRIDVLHNTKINTEEMNYDQKECI